MSQIGNLDFNKGGGLVPAVIQDFRTKQVLMLGYMNAEALEQTQKSKKVVFFSRSKARLWTKGESSGNFLNVKQILVDCDNDSLLVLAEPEGPTCHKGTDSCFGDAIRDEDCFLSVLADIIAERHANPDADSYTSSLFKEGLDRIVQKVGEEAVEVVIAAKNSDPKLFCSEVADLVFHLLVLLELKQLSLSEIVEVLEKRNKR